MTQTIQTLPTECIIEVFKHLNWTELKKLTQTCKQFNEIVSTNTKLLENIRFCYTRRFGKLNQTRKYTKFYINDCSDQVLQLFQSNFEENLKNIREMTIGSFNRFKMTNLVQILVNCESLRNLKFEQHFDLAQKVDDEEVIEEINLKLETLTILDNYKVLKYLRKSTVKNLKLQKSDDTESLRKFLETQNELENLQLDNFKEFSVFVNENYNFKLKKLTLENCVASPKLAEFLIAHQNSIENVKIKGIISSCLINMLTNLHRINLKIDFGSFINSDPISVLSNVQNLEMTCKNITTTTTVDFSNFDDKFPNLKSLRVDKFENFKPTSSFELLESFTVERTTIKGQLKIPKVKNLKFTDCTFQMIRTPYDFNKNSVENLTVKRCFFAAWIYQLMQHKATKLNSLTLHNKIGSYQKEIELRQKACDDNQHKVKDFKIVYL